MSQQANYFKVGIFVITAFIVAMMLLLLLAGNALLDKSECMETYFNESVQGLSVGSQVKMRGVPVGSVKSISFYYSHNSPKKYKGLGLIRVVMKIHQASFDVPLHKNLENIGRQEMKKGLRAQLRPQGLTGQTYIEFDYFNTNEFKSITVPWRTEYFMMPSVKSTINTLFETISHIAKQVEEAHIDVIGQKVQDVLDMLKNTDLDKSMQKVNKLLDNAQQFDFKGLSKQLSSVLKNIDDADLKGIADHVNAVLAEIKKANLSALSFTAKETLKEITGLIRHERVSIKSILNSLSLVLKNAVDITEDLKQNPASFLFAEPPARLTLKDK